MTMIRACHLLNLVRNVIDKISHFLMYFCLFVYLFQFVSYPADDELSLLNSGKKGGSGIVAKVTFLLLFTALAVVVGIVFFELAGQKVPIQSDSPPSKASVIQEPVVEEFIAPSPIAPQGIFILIFIASIQ